MTLDDLIKAVEAGEATRTEMKDLAAAVFGLSITSVAIGSAYACDDLSDARVVHKLLLPGWKVGVLHEEWNGKWSCRIYGLRPEDGAYAEASDPARAWLLAIFKAKQAEIKA